jgi:phytoene/squalene synthetase
MDSKNFQELVRNVSRSFSLTLLGLPHLQRNSISVTYILARFADALTDSGNWPTEVRTSHLAAWESAISQRNPGIWKLKTSVGGFKENEAHLLLEGENLLKIFLGLPETHILHGQEVLKILIQGMKWDLKTFLRSDEVIFGVKNPPFLDWYCYSIAGCVGAYWVKMFELPSTLEPLAVAYGKGLQRINILRDVVADWDRKRVYLPESELLKFELKEAKFWNKPSWKDFCEDYISETKKLLFYGANFCDSIPYSSFRLRWSSAMPLQIGLATLQKIEETKEWQPEIKISRRDVKKLAISTAWSVISHRKFS